MPSESRTALLSERSTDPGKRSGKDRLADTFLPLYERLFDDDQSDFVDEVNRKIGEARRDEPVETFISMSLGYGVLTGLFLWLLGLFIGAMIIYIVQFPVEDLVDTPLTFTGWQMVAYEILKGPVVVIVMGVVFGSIGFALGFASPIVNLYLQAGERKREINSLLPHAVAFMYALSVGGMNQLDILESTARADDVYGEVSKEFDVILKETRYFGVDYRTAIRNRAMETPSDEFGQFLTDMLSILSSGGDMTSFLDEQKDKFLRTATQQQEQELETLELFGEMYMTLSLFPLLLIILLVIMEMIGGDQGMMLLLTVYGLIPMTGIVFLVLISTVKQDDPGDGYLIPDKDDPYVRSDTSALGMGVIEQFTAPYSILDRIRSREGAFKAKRILRRPDKLFMERPEFTFAITIPVAILIVVYAVLGDIVATDLEGMAEQEVWNTVIYVYLPIYLTAIPYATFYELRERNRKSITTNLSDNLRKLASANDTGQTLLGSFKVVADTSGGTLAKEFETIYTKVQYGTSMKQALIEFNNKYHLPRLARTMKLIAKAQETSSQITPVLKTAAMSSEEQDRLAAERKTRTRMQVVIILMTYCTLLAVMVLLRIEFLEPMSELTDQADSGGDAGDAAGGGAAGGFGDADIDVDMLSLYFFHAVTLQAITAAFIAGYLRTSKIQSGIKFLVILPTIALVAWVLLV